MLIVGTCAGESASPHGGGGVALQAGYHRVQGVQPAAGVGKLLVEDGNAVWALPCSTCMSLHGGLVGASPLELARGAASCCWAVAEWKSLLRPCAVGISGDLALPWLQSTSVVLVVLLERGFIQLGTPSVEG